MAACRFESFLVLFRKVAELLCFGMDEARSVRADLYSTDRPLGACAPIMLSERLQGYGARWT